MSRLEMLKRRFLRKYNEERTIERALRAGIRAAVQHNPLYRPGLDPQKREEVRAHWRALLCKTLCGYEVRSPTPSTYKRDISDLKRRMNGKFKKDSLATAHAERELAPGFRISHAQKSLGVALKHLWCMGRVKKPPPHCPIDSRVLRRAGKHYPETRWAHINSMKEYGTKLAALARAATKARQGLAEWELEQFDARHRGGSRSKRRPARRRRTVGPPDARASPDIHTRPGSLG